MGKARHSARRPELTPLESGRAEIVLTTPRSMSGVRRRGGDVIARVELLGISPVDLGKALLAGAVSVR